jgi:hypothetical protein
MLTAGNRIRLEGRCWEIVHTEWSKGDDLIGLRAEPCVVEHDPELPTG